MFCEIDLRKLNSMTKYPSIETYHVLGQKGRLTEEARTFDGPLIATEKVDGTNARVISFGVEKLIGSREEFLHYVGDLIWNPTQEIVEAVKPSVAMFQSLRPHDTFAIWFMEVYGGKGVSKNSKQYTGTKAHGFRVFDIMEMTVDELREMLGWPLEKIASWRQHGGQRFMSEERLNLLADTMEFKVTPRIGTFDAIPTGLQEMQDWLAEHIPTTQVALDDSAKGRAEGIVLRSADRKHIVKARFEDYRRTLR